MDRQPDFSSTILGFAAASWRDLFTRLLVGSSQRLSETNRQAGTAGAGRKPITISPEQIVQKQVDAFNRRDLDAFLATYSSDIKLYDFPDKVTLSGLEAMRKSYGTRLTDNPDRKANVPKRHLPRGPLPLAGVAVRTPNEIRAQFPPL